MWRAVQETLPPSNRVSPLDASFWNIDTPTTPQTIASFGVLEGAPDRALLHEQFQSLLNLFPRLTCLITDTGRLFWTRDPHFQLERHLRFVDPLPNEAPERTLSRLFSEPIDKEHPPWEFLVVSSGFFLFKLHHTLADGMGGLALLDVLFNGARTKESRSPKSPPEPASPLPLRVWALLRSLLARNPSSSGHQSPLSSEKFSFKGKNSPERSLLFFDLPLSELRTLKHSFGVSLNDLFLLLCCRAVRRVSLKAKGPLPDVQAIMPVSTRPLSHRHELGNQLLAVNLPLPLDCESLVEHLMAIRRVTQSYKQGATLESFECLAFVGSYLPRWLQRPVGELFLRGTSFICTNMPLPRLRRSLAGAPIISQYGVPALLRSHGVGFSLMTYTDRACFSIVTDPQIVSRPEELRKEIEESFALLTSLPQKESSPNQSTSLPRRRKNDR